MKIDLNKSGAQLIMEEQKRIIEVEGFTAENDKKYHNQELVRASICYLRRPFYAPHIQSGKNAPTDFPFKEGMWKPNNQNRIEELIKAGALLACEIDKLRTENNTFTYGTDGKKQTG